MEEIWNVTHVPFGSLPVFEVYDLDVPVQDSSVDVNDSSVMSNFSAPLDVNSTVVGGIPAEFLAMSANSRNCVVAYLFLFVIAATGNFSVFFSVVQQLRRTKSRISVFILHLSLADLLVTFGVIPLEVVWRITVQWYGGNGLCKFCKFFSAFGLYLSSFVLICISMDRYFVIIHPLRVTDARRRGRLMLFSAWIMATLCSLPQVFIFHVESHPKYGSFHQCVSLGFFASAGEELIYNVFSVAFMYFIPLTIVIFTYVMIICKITRKSRQHSQSRKLPEAGGGRILLRRSDASNHMERARNKTLKLTCLIVTVFVLCSTPYVVMTLWYMFDRESATKVDEQIQDGLFLMVVSNSCLNPLVYGTFTRECRESMRNWCCYTKTRMVNGDQGQIRSRRRPMNGGGGLRRQSQLKMLYTTAKRPTSKEALQSFKALPVNPNRITNPLQEPHNQKPPSSYRMGMGYSNSSVPTSMATLNDDRGSPSSPLNVGSVPGGRFFRDSNGSIRRPRHHTTSLYPPPRSASLNVPNFVGSVPPQGAPPLNNCIKEESDIVSGPMDSLGHKDPLDDANHVHVKLTDLQNGSKVPENRKYSISLSNSTALCKMENLKVNCVAVA